MRFSVGCLMPPFLENPPTRPRPPRSVASAAAEPRPHIHALPRQGCPSSLLEERRPGATWGPPGAGRSGEVTRCWPRRGERSPRGPGPSRGGQEGKARLGTRPPSASAGALPWAPLSPARARGGLDVPLVEERGGTGAAGRPPPGEDTGRSRSGPPGAGLGTGGWGRHKGLFRPRGRGAQRALFHSRSGDKPFRRPALGRGLQEAGLPSGWDGSDFNELTSEGRIIGKALGSNKLSELFCKKLWRSGSKAGSAMAV